MAIGMAASVQYHCACLSSSPVPPPPHLPSSVYNFHPLHTLFFCEECDAVRCNRCVSVEVSTYYCPNCLFEVPSASVRAEKNRSVPIRVAFPFSLDDTEPDVLGIASCARIAGIPFLSCHRTLQTRTTAASLSLSAQSVNLLSSCTVIIADGTLPRLASHSKSLPVLLVSWLFRKFQKK